MARVTELDSIRGLSALSIVVFHLGWIPLGLLSTPTFLFFILSGYLITSIILTHPPTEGFLLAFYMRRGLRIWPIYYLALLFLVVINPWTAHPARLDNLPHYLTFTQLVPQYWSDTSPAPIPAFEHTWSLAVEEQFYLIWPALIIVLGRKAVGRAALTVVCLSLAMRTVGVNGWTLATNCDRLALGALLAGLVHGRTASEARRLYTGRFAAVGLVGAVCVASSFVFRVPPAGPLPDLAPALAAARHLAINLAYFAVVGLTVLHAGHRRLAVLRDRRLVYLGEISYGIYLYHYIIFMLADDYAARYGLGRGMAWDLAKVAASLAVAALSYRFVERPVLSLKNLFPYPAAGRKAAVPSSALLAGPEEG